MPFFVATNSTFERSQRRSVIAFVLEVTTEQELEIGVR
jgi:hypothetical protein